VGGTKKGGEEMLVMWEYETVWAVYQFGEGEVLAEVEGHRKYRPSGMVPRSRPLVGE